MKKLKNFEDFRNENIELDDNQSIFVFGGLTQETNNWCFTLNDTCVNNNSDIRHIRERDGVVLSDTTIATNMSHCY